MGQKVKQHFEFDVCVLAGMTWTEEWNLAFVGLHAAYSFTLHGKVEVPMFEAEVHSCMYFTYTQKSTKVSSFQYEFCLYKKIVCYQWNVFRSKLEIQTNGNFWSFGYCRCCWRRDGYNLIWFVGLFFFVKSIFYTNCLFNLPVVFVARFIYAF